MYVSMCYYPIVSDRRVTLWLSRWKRDMIRIHWTHTGGAWRFRNSVELLSGEGLHPRTSRKNHILVHVAITLYLCPEWSLLLLKHFEKYSMKRYNLFSNQFIEAWHCKQQPFFMFPYVCTCARENIYSRNFCNYLCSSHLQHKRHSTCWKMTIEKTFKSRQKGAKRLESKKFIHFVLRYNEKKQKKHVYVFCAIHFSI